MHDAGRSELQELLSGDGTSLLDALMAFIPLGLTIAAPPDVLILRVSDAGTALLGRSRDRLENITLGQHSEAYEVYDSLTGQLAPPKCLPLTRATLEGEIVRNEEWLLRSGIGTEITILCNAGPIRNSVGEVIGGMIAWADISKQKQLESDLLEAITQRDRLLSELHHRIGNHLQLVGALLRMEARQSQQVGAVVERVEQRLLALSRAYSALRGTVEDVPAAAFLSDVCEPLQTAHIRTEIQTETGLTVSSGVAPTLGIVVNEAVCNALKHAFPEQRAGVVKVTLGKRDRHLVLRVSDDGLGMKPTTTGEGQGQGLMSHLMKSVGGRIELSSRPNEGTTVTAYWPAGSGRGGDATV